MPAIFSSYQDILFADADGGADLFRPSPLDEGAPCGVPADIYTARIWHEREKLHLWSRTWQMACRSEQVAAPGDQHVYEIADLSFLVVRGADERIRAFRNACLHRGRRLRSFSGHDAEVRCPFHGITWNLDGSLKRLPCAPEFGRHDTESWHLGEIPTGEWGGFVFLNPDSGASSLEQHLAGLDAQFERWPLERRYLAKHVVKRLRCNWKVAQEAFMESYHVAGTHPQSVWGTGDLLSQYDAYGSFSRAITPRGVSSPKLDRTDQQRILDGLLNRLSRNDRVEVPEGRSARSVYADTQRDVLRREIGPAVDDLTTAELCDLVYFTVYPNFHPWGGYYQSIYRFRPNGDEHETCLMDFMLLAPFDGDRPAPAQAEWVDFDDSWTIAVGPRGRIFDQDSLNMPQVQLGLHSLKPGAVRFAGYQETKIRHFYSLYRAALGVDASKGDLSW